MPAEPSPPEWSIQEIAKLTGTTSRTLRHYDHVGLLRPTRIAANGYRHYGEVALVRLQRILLLRELGLGLAEIAETLEQTRRRPNETAGAAVRPRAAPGEARTITALQDHLDRLHGEQRRLARQMASVEHTIHTLRDGGRLMAEKMFDGFDHTEHKAEVEQRWGAEAYAKSDAWWRGMSGTERVEWRAALARLNAEWADAASRSLDPGGTEAQALAHRQFEWLREVPGTPHGPDGGPSREYFTGLAELYPSDERFAANYGGIAGATFVRDAMRAYAEREL